LLGGFEWFGSRVVWKVWLTIMEFNILWLPTVSESSLDKPDMESQCLNDELVSSTVIWVFLGICVWRGSVPAAEAVNCLLLF